MMTISLDKRYQHRWDLSIDEARALQVQLAMQVRVENRLPSISYVAGVDVGFEQKHTARAAVAVLRADDLQLVDFAIARVPVSFPYVPGYLSFRECPAILEALGQLQQLPDLLLCDGQGIAHPRRFGVACHLGLLTGIPSIGVAKSRLVGHHGELAAAKGSWQPLMDKPRSQDKPRLCRELSETEEVCIGAVLRSRDEVKPLYVSPGHLIDIDTSVAWVMRCLTRYRLPETTRWADGIASHRSDRWLVEAQRLRTQARASGAPGRKSGREQKRL